MSGPSATGFKSVAYGYNPPSTSQMNNGNIYTVTNLKDSTRTQTFTYDVLNRLATAQDQTHWYNSYVYDAWGNLMMSPMSGKAHGGMFQHAGDANNHASGLGYDAAGNLTDYSAPNQYVYDPENRIQSTAGTTYTYDSDGERVEKAGGSAGTLYWYGMPGIIAESDLSGNLKSEYVFVAVSALLGLIWSTTACTTISQIISTPPAWSSVRPAS